MAIGEYRWVWLQILVVLGCFAIGNNSVSAQTTAPATAPTTTDTTESLQYRFEWQTKLLNSLFANYHKEVPPKRGNGPVMVELKFQLLKFNFIDEANEIASVHCQLHQTWFDTRLSWNPALHNGTQFMIVRVDHLWLPDVILYNSGITTHTIEKKAYVHFSGTVVYVAIMQIEFVCGMDLTFFPYDEQICELRFGSIYNDINSLNLTDAPPDVLRGKDKKLFKMPSDFVLKSVTAKRNVETYYWQSFVDVGYAIHLTRISSAHFARLVLPAVLTGFLILVTFLLPAASLERVTLCGLIFVSLLLQFSHLYEIVPLSGDTILGEFLGFAMFLDLFAAVFAAISYHIHLKCRKPQQQQQQPPSDMMMDEEKKDAGNYSGWTKRMIDCMRPILPYLDFILFFIFGIILIVGMAIILGRRGKATVE